MDRYGSMSIRGNKIARFDPINNALYEYWIPTQNRLCGDCPPSSWIANVLQFSIDENGQTKFTELSEHPPIVVW
jgi:virginiamycin B lyase